jgi:predicted porin
MNAKFHIEYDLVDIGTGGNGQTSTAATADVNAATSAAGSGFGARLAYVGLEGKSWGEIRAGRQAQLTHSVIANGLAGGGNNVAGSFYSSGMNSMINTAAIRPHLVFVNRAITYLTPNLGGVVLGLQTSSQSVQTNDNVLATTANYTDASIAFTGVKNLNLQASYSVANNETASAAANKVNVMALTGNYNFGPLTAFAAAVQNKTVSMANVNFAKTTTYEFGVRAPVTKVVTLWASGFTGSRDGGSTTAATALIGGNAITAATGSADTSGYQAGAVYSFSKRSSMYAIYGTQSLKGKNQQTTAKVESNGLALGLRHTF